MTTTRTASIGALLLLCGGCFLASCLAGESFLRGAGNVRDYAFDVDEDGDESTRQLQGVGATIVNALISMVTPAISKAVQNLMKLEYETLSLSRTETIAWQELGDVVENITLHLNGSTIDTAINCESSTRARYALESVAGLESIHIDKLEFVSGSQQVDVGFLGRSDTTWQGQWRAGVTFAYNLIGATNAILTTTTSCDDTDGMDTTIDKEGETTNTNGTIVLSGTTAETLLTVYGSTGRLVFFPTTTTVNSAQVESLTVNLPSITTNLGASLDTTASSGSRGMPTRTIDVDEVFGSIVESGLQEYLERLMIVAVQEETNGRLPVELVV